MELRKATQIADELVSKLRPYCDRIEIAGSIRRGKKEIHDIDIVAILDQDRLFNGGYLGEKHLIGTMAWSVRANGRSLASFIYRSVSVDIYWATPQNWATLLLIRTGSKEHNIRLCQLARQKGWQLKANGAGLFNEHNQRIAGDTEEDIFEALGIVFIPPEKREA